MPETGRNDSVDPKISARVATFRGERYDGYLRAGRVAELADARDLKSRGG